MLRQCARYHSIYSSCGCICWPGKTDICAPFILSRNCFYSFWFVCFAFGCFRHRLLLLLLLSCCCCCFKMFLLFMCCHWNWIRNHMLWQLPSRYYPSLPPAIDQSSPSLLLCVSFSVCVSHSHSCFSICIFCSSSSSRTRCRVWKTVCFTWSKLVRWLFWQYLILSHKLSFAQAEQKLGEKCVYVHS